MPLRASGASVKCACCTPRNHATVLQSQRSRCVHAKPLLINGLISILISSLFNLRNGNLAYESLPGFVGPLLRRVARDERAAAALSTQVSPRVTNLSHQTNSKRSTKLIRTKCFSSLVTVHPRRVGNATIFMGSETLKCMQFALFITIILSTREIY